MFDHLGWSEIVLLAVVGLVVLGPDKLPNAIRDAVRTMRQLRTMARNASADLKAELGPEMADLDLNSLHPRRLIGSVLDDDDEGDGVASSRLSTRLLEPGERPPYDDDAT